MFTYDQICEATASGLELLNKSSYASELGIDPRSVRKEPLFFIRARGKTEAIYGLRRSDLAEYKRLRQELFG